MPSKQATCTYTEWDVYEHQGNLALKSLKKNNENGSEAIENNNEKKKQIRLAHVLY